MHDSRRSGGCSTSEIPALDQRGTETTHCRIARHAAPDDAATDHNDVELLSSY
jgi:hypothetical protein